MEVQQPEAKLDIHARVTNEIIKAIEAGAPDFEMPWHQKPAGGLPRNAATGNGYRGINALSLWSAARMKGYGASNWASYRQWNSLGAKVRSGEKSSIVVFFKRESGEEEPAEGSKRKSKVVLRYSSVFNAAQVEGWDGEMSDAPRIDRVLHLAPVDVFVEALGADIRYGDTAAYYSPSHDRIHMPPREDFVSSATRSETEAFYSVLLHEHVHWSGHSTRLDRKLVGQFGSAAYAMEELVAELGAAFLCAELGISVHARKDHAGYVATWLTVLREQKTAIFKAASSASIASAYLVARGYLPKEQSEEALNVH